MPNKTNAPGERGACKNRNVTSRVDNSNSDGLSQRIPINLPAERSVLGALIEDDSLLPEVIAAGLRAGDFSLSDHRQVFAAILALREQKSPIDYITVTEKLGNRQEDYVLLASLIHGVVVHEDHTLYHVAMVRRKSQLRTLLRIAEWLTRVVDDAADPDALIEQAIRKLDAVATAEVTA
jgi:replicative DNA helicase